MSTYNQSAATSTPGSGVDSQRKDASAYAARPRSDNKAVVIGLYGIPGSGKTTLLNQLKHELEHENFGFYEGSKMIAEVTPGGLEAFQRLDEQEKIHRRQLAIDAIKMDCADRGRVAIVAGHFMFWPDEQGNEQPVYTQNDLETFTHILYLDVAAEEIAQRRQDDTDRIRSSVSIAHLHKWQQAEKMQLRHLCLEHGILFSLVSLLPTSLDRLLNLLRDFQHHTEDFNLSCAEKRLDEIINIGRDQWETVLVLDADRTLAAEDTGALFWNRISHVGRMRNDECTLKTLFSSSLGYSYTAFRQATLLYEEAADDEEFDTYCHDVASMVTMHPQFKSLLQLVAEKEYVGAVIISCGLRLVWEKVIERAGLSGVVTVIGGGRVRDGLVVTPAVKGALVTRLRDVHQVYVWAFGDSPLDLIMLSKADQAIVVVGEDHTRSKSMDALLAEAIKDGDLSARQTLLPSTASPRLDSARLPVIKLTEHGFIESVFCRRYGQPGFQIFHATTKNAARLLMTPTRNNKVAGPAQREAHRQVGWYLAIEFVTELVGLEEYPIEHVQGHSVGGYRLFNESQTSIVALMRAGEPMAFGVSDAFPKAMFVHASQPQDIKMHHLHGQHTVLLVDSVINSGKTVVKFVQHICKLHASVRIVVVAGVVQAQSVAKNNQIRALARSSDLTIVALRLSENKFTGKGTTDTGNRLFNTTHLIDS